MLYGNSITPFVGLRREIDRLFEDASGGRMTWMPAVDVREDTSNLTIDFELPGIDPDQVEVTAENGVLTVRGEKRAERKEGKEGRWHLVERSYGSFSRSFQLPAGIDEGQIDAQFENGLLQVRIPKAALPRPRRIQVQRSGNVEGGSSQRSVSSGEREGSRNGQRDRQNGNEERDRSSSGAQRETSAQGKATKERESREPATAGR